MALLLVLCLYLSNSAKFNLAKFNARNNALTIVDWVWILVWNISFWINAFGVPLFCVYSLLFKFLPHLISFWNKSFLSVYTSICRIQFSKWKRGTVWPLEGLIRIRSWQILPGKNILNFRKSFVKFAYFVLICGFAKRNSCEEKKSQNYVFTFVNHWSILAGK